ncbi:MAG: hypothetical protein R2854_17250 [Caldilineaceae bacterium]
MDGALVACGFGTVYEALNCMRASGEDRVLIVGMGPVGMAAGLLAKKMGAPQVIGVDLPGTPRFLSGNRHDRPSDWGRDEAVARSRR